jgi:hypothetical protein
MESKQQKAKIRICASCGRVFIIYKGCPCCGFASYGSIWAIGFWKTIIRLLVHSITKPRNKEIYWI